jgi:hypothetical protein
MKLGGDGIILVDDGSFIDLTTRTWWEALVRECCLPCDVDVVLAIKLPTRPCEDFVAWGFKPNGMFSVCSAYHLGLQPVIDNLSTGQSSTAPDGDRELWNIIWKANVPQKL